MLQIFGEERNFGELNDLPDVKAAGGYLLCSSEEGSSPGVASKSTMEQEKRIRREIANSNERRRMQSINAGFQTLRSLLPRQEGEKLSKAAILQQTSDFIYSLEQEKTRLLTQNCQLKRLLGQQQPASGAESDTAAESPASARRSVSQESEGEEARPGSVPAAAASPAAPHAALEPLRVQVLDLRGQLEQEQQLRRLLEERLLKAEQVTVKEEIKLDEELSPRRQPPSPRHQEVVPVVYHDAPAHQLPSPKYHSLPSPHHEIRSPVPSLSMPSPRHHPVASPKPALYEAELASDRREKLCAAAVPRQVHMCFKKPRLDIPSAEERLAPPPPPSAPAPSAVTLPSPQLVEQSEEVFVQHRPLYMSSTTSRQNLDTIVEAIRHLEGDHLFREMTESPAASASPCTAATEQRLPSVPEPQEAPLELTTHTRSYQPPVVGELLYPRPGTASATATTQRHLQQALLRQQTDGHLL